MRKPHTQYALDRLVKYLLVSQSPVPRAGRVSVCRPWKYVSFVEDIPTSGLEVTVWGRPYASEAGPVPIIPLEVPHLLCFSWLLCESVTPEEEKAFP